MLGIPRGTRLNGTSRKGKGNGPPGGSLGFALDRCWVDFSPRSWKSGRRQVRPTSNPIPLHPSPRRHQQQAGQCGAVESLHAVRRARPSGETTEVAGSDFEQQRHPRCRKEPTEISMQGEQQGRKSFPTMSVSSGHPLGKVSSHGSGSGSGSKKSKGVSRAMLPLQSVGRVRLWPLLAAGGGWPSVCSLVRRRIWEVSAPVGPHCSPSWVCVCLFLGGN